MGPAPYSPRPWDDNLFDYCGTRFLDGISSLFSSSMRRQLIWLLRYSISGWDQLPILLVHETITYSTTAVLDFRMGPAPYFSHKTTIYSTTAVLDLRMGHALYLPRWIYSSMRRQSIDYYHTRSLDGTRSLHPKKTHSSRLQDNKLSVYSGTRPTDGTCSLSRKRISTSTRQLVDYLEEHSTTTVLEETNQASHIKATSRSAVNSKEGTIHQNVKSTAMDNWPHKNQEDITTTV